ncbi:MAG: methyltransferase domain-containing protein [Candidatus Pacebacteria bacterium]|nr:methyltransferase domain-containing protein [Candidatus Paceibacterota bacterium]
MRNEFCKTSEVETVLDQKKIEEKGRPERDRTFEEETPLETEEESKARREKIEKDRKLHKIEHRVLDQLNKPREGVMKKPIDFVNKKLGEGWLENRGRDQAEESGINEAIKEIIDRIAEEKFLEELRRKIANFDDKVMAIKEEAKEGVEEESNISGVTDETQKNKIVIADICSGKSGINEAILKKFSERNIEIIGFDESDHATKKVSESSDHNIGSAYAIGEQLPLKDESVDIVKFDFAFQEADEKTRIRFIEEAKRILKSGGMITFIDELPQDSFVSRQSNKLKSRLYNRRFGKLDIQENDKLSKFFTENGLEIVKRKCFREDGNSEKPAQFVSYILKEAEQVGE